jgi:hypothetical protein
MIVKLITEDKMSRFIANFVIKKYKDVHPPFAANLYFVPIRVQPNFSIKIE